MVESDLVGELSRTEPYRSIPALPPDIEIAWRALLKPIVSIGQEIGLSDDELELYGEFKAKVKQNAFDRLCDQEDGKLILVTAMTPTRAGEGKTGPVLDLLRPWGS